MSVADNQERFRSFFEELANQKNAAAFDEYVSADFVEHEDLSPFSPNREGAKQFFAAMLEGFPDMSVTVDDMIGEGDKVWARTTWRGTHTGEFQGISATNKEFTISVIDIVRYSEGKQVEHWGVSDIFGMMTQLGVISPPG